MALPRRNAAFQEVFERLDRQAGRIAELERELARVSPQVAAIEARIEDLRGTVERASLPPGDEATVASALERIEREHAQVRARISAATRFEERLRVLEDRGEPNT